MDFLSENLPQNEELDRRIATISSFNSAKCYIRHGRILSVPLTNISFIEPHKAVIDLKGKKLILIYINRETIFLFNRTMPMRLGHLDKILKEIKNSFI